MIDAANTEQLSQIVDKLEDEVSDDDRYLSHEEPLRLFDSALDLTLEQEERLMSHAVNRYQQLTEEMGADGEFDEDTGDALLHGDLSRPQGHFAKRRLYDELYHLDLSWREGVQGSIFKNESNLHFPITRRNVQQQIARAQNYFFGTDPWIAVSPKPRPHIPAPDQELTRRLHHYALQKAADAGIKTDMLGAIEGAFIRGESVLKTTHRVDDDWYHENLEVLVDPESGKALMAEGDYITRSDTWRAHLDPETGEPVANPETGAPIMVLVKAPNVSRPSGELTFEMRRVRRRHISYSGADTSEVFYGDLLAPLDAKNLDEADCVIHRYDRPAIDLAQAFLKRNHDGDDAASHARFIDFVQSLQGQGEKKSAAAAARAGEDLDPGDNTRREPNVFVAESYMHYDVDGDGIIENIVLVWDIENKRPIYYDYVRNFSITKSRPFDVVRINPVSDRWYGRSSIDLFWDQQQFLDLTWNRLNFASSGSDRVDFFYPHLTEEGKDNPDLQIGGGQSYTVARGTPDDAIPLRSVYLTNIKHSEYESIMQMVIQMMTNMGGTATANDSSMAGLDTGKLATGVRNIEKSGQELFAPWLTHLTPGLEGAASKFLTVTTKTLNTPEVFRYFEGDQVQVAEIRPDEVADLEFSVIMELTRYKGEQQLVQGNQAIELITAFYAQPLDLQPLTAPLYRHQLTLFEIPNGDQIIVPGVYTTLMPVGPPGVDAQSAQAARTSDRPIEPNL